MSEAAHPKPDSFHLIRIISILGFLFSVFLAYKIGVHAAVYPTKVNGAKSSTSNLATSPGRTRHYFASQPDVKSIMSKFKWLGGNEVAAVKYLTVLSAIQSGRSKNDLRYREYLKPELQQIWEEHPIIASAFVCKYCGSAYRIPLNFAKKTKIKEDVATQLGHNNSNYFAALSTSGHFTEEEEIKLAKRYARTMYQSEAHSLQTIAGILIEHNALDELLLMLKISQNSGFAFEKISDLTSVPRHILTAAWDRSASKGQVPQKLTRHLMSTGYRPALRLAIWMEARSVDYFSADNQHYKIWWGNNSGSLVDEFTSFPYKKGPGLSEFYSANWRDIRWDPRQKKWRHES